MDPIFNTLAHHQVTYILEVNLAERSGIEKQFRHIGDDANSYFITKSSFFLLSNHSFLIFLLFLCCLDHIPHFDIQAQKVISRKGYNSFYLKHGCK